MVKEKLNNGKGQRFRRIGGCRVTIREYLIF